MSNAAPYFKICKIIFTAMALITLPTVAKADINYTFVKMTCNPSSNSATIKAFYDWNASGEARAKWHEKDTYYLDEIAGSSKEITCELGKNQTISFTASEDGAHPRNNDLKVLLNHHPIQNDFTFALTDEWTLDIRLIAPDRYDFTFCPKNPYSLKAVDLDKLEGLTLPSKKICEILHIVKGWVESTDIFDSSQRGSQ